MKILINKCYGGFSLSMDAALWCYENGYKELGTPIDEYFGKEKDFVNKEKLAKTVALEKWQNYLGNKEKSNVFLTPFSKDEKYVLNTRPSNRSHPVLIDCFEIMGSEKMSGFCAELRIVEIPDGIEYHIEEYDGMEHVAENHRTWY